MEPAEEVVMTGKKVTACWAACEFAREVSYPAQPLTWLCTHLSPHHGHRRSLLLHSNGGGGCAKEVV